MAEHKRIGEVQTARFVLEVYECGRCEFHIGVDASYLDQVGDMNVKCPNCNAEIDTDDCMDEVIEDIIGK